MRVAVAQIEPRLAEKERNLDVCSRAARGGRGRRRRAARAAGVRDPRLHVRQRRGGAARTRRRSPARRPRRSSASARGSASTRLRPARARRRHALQRRDSRRPRRADRLLPQDAPAVPRRRPLRHPGRRASRSSTRRSAGSASIICYDLRFPEVTRTLALHGADIVALPTNFPMAAKVQTEVITLARAAENRIYLLVANRVGKERTGEFCGWSQIVDPYGTRLAEADATRRRCSSRTSTSRRRGTRTTSSPGSTSCYLFGHRRPELYGALVEETPAAGLRRRSSDGARSTSSSRRPADQDGGVKVSKSPWGPDDEIGRLNWITPETNAAILEHLDGSHALRPERRVLHRHAVVGRGRRPAVRDLDDAHAAGLDQRQPLRRRRRRATRSTRTAATRSTSTPTAGRTSTRSTTSASTACSGTGGRRTRTSAAASGTRAAPSKYPPIIARGVLLDVAGLHGVDCLPDGYAITPEDLQDARAKQGVELRRRTSCSSAPAG